jgi:hypothetical protein
MTPNALPQHEVSGSESIFFCAKPSQPTPKAGMNKTIGEQPGGEIQSGNG